MGYLGVLLVFAVLSFGTAEEGCPPAGDISPCNCDGEGISCISKNVKEDHVKKAFSKNFKYGGVLNIYIQGTSLTKIPAGIFSQVKAQSFYLEVNEIESVDMKAFDHTKEHIRSFSFFGNKLTSFNFNALKEPEYPQLGVINLARNKLTSIPSDAFVHDGIYSIILAKNSISSIGQNAFNKVPSLTRLELSENKLKTLGPYALALEHNTPGLEINLAANEIADISNTAFDGASPQAIYLSVNKLQSLKQAVFSSLLSRIAGHGGIIDVTGNPLTCKGCDYRWIVNSKYSLSHMIVGFGCPDGLGITDITGNDIGC